MGLRLWQVELFICPAESLSSELNTYRDWHMLFLPALPLFFSSVANEVSTLMMFFLVALILLTWRVTPRCSSLRGYPRLSTAVNLPQQCMGLSVCACTCICASFCRLPLLFFFFFLLIKQESFAVFACPMAHASELSCPGKSSLWTVAYFRI